LIICESDTPVADLFSKNPVLFDEVINGPLLMLVQPASDASNDEREWRENRGHLHILTSVKWSGLFPGTQRVRVSVPYAFSITNPIAQIVRRLGRI
jgi:hypothetical protein